MQGKIKRTVPFYVDHFNALKAVVPPEVCKVLGALSNFEFSPRCYHKGCRSNQSQHVPTDLDPSASRLRWDLRPGRIQVRR
jgi:hypothetical protein